MIVAVGLTAVGCSKVPRHYVRMAEPDATLTDLVAHPEKYRGKVVLLGGALIEEEATEQYLWLRLKNRPLDQDHMPHRPADMSGSEAGSYWVLVAKEKLPPQYHKWARITVAGRVTGARRLETEPVLALLYVRGWGVSGDHDGVWDSLTDRNYSPSLPTDIGGELGGGMR
jgi:outer membrane lipoprotein